MSDNPVVIVAATRTPIGDLQGSLSTVTAADLGAVAIKGALEQGHVGAQAIDQVIMGCVLSAGQGQAPARQASLKAGLSNTTPCTTINKMCGSGLQAVIMGHDALLAGSSETVLVGGLESMSNAPYLVPGARQGLRMGHRTFVDHMFIDGLEDAYERGTLMGVYADRTAEKYDISRETQDEFTLNSLSKAQNAASSGAFNDEIVPVEVKSKRGSDQVVIDELPTKARPEKIPLLKPAFNTNGTVTAANASGISDGASALILTRLKTAKKQGWPVLARIAAHGTSAHEPQWFTTAPIGAIEGALKRAQWQINDVDLFEINEAFAVVTLAAMKTLKLPAEKINIHGGACALGHPIGASGARILTTLTHALKTHQVSKGVATLCIGGGEAVAVAIEREA
ncbi:MAG: acetyl-CoA C-acyltransferase [Legionellales bacterium]|nr:acetyl-CoA C-acyltransferase [Legionellales bacterium]